MPCVFVCLYVSASFSIFFRSVPWLFFQAEVTGTRVLTNPKGKPKGLGYVTFDSEVCTNLANLFRRIGLLRETTAVRQYTAYELLVEVVLRLTAGRAWCLCRPVSVRPRQLQHDGKRVRHARK